MLACVCGGWIELLALLLGCGLTGWITALWNKCKRPCCKEKNDDSKN